VKLTELFNRVHCGTSGTRLGVFACLVLLPLIQVTSLWFYQGSKVDEAELVLFGVGFLGGDLDPQWDGYGHLGMYLLGGLYFLMGWSAIIFGEFDSFIQYAADNIFTGDFYVAARLFMAVCWMLAAVICAKLLRIQGARPWVTVLFVIFIAVSPVTLKYANYVRSDTLVALFTVCVLYSAVAMVGFRSCVYVAIFTAAAIACKISAVTIAGLLGLMTAWQIFNSKISWINAICLIAIFICFVFLFSPHMDYYGLLKRVISLEVGAENTNAVRLDYLGFAQRITRIYQFHVGALGLGVCLLAGLSPFAFFTKYRELLAAVWMLLFLTVLPYMFGTTLREYWFIASYMLCLVLAVISISSALDFIEQKVTASVFRVLSMACAASITIMVVGVSANTYASKISSLIAHPVSNRDLAQKWLEEEHVGVTPIFIDRHFPWVYPRVYDLSYLKTSRSISNLFAYERRANKFLATAFEEYLYTEYRGINGGNETVLTEFRLDMNSSVTYAQKPKICSAFSELCFDLELTGSNHVDLAHQNDGSYSVRSIGEDSYLIFKLNRWVPIDGSYYLDIETDASRWQLIYNWGDGYFSKNATIFYGYHGNEQKVHLFSTIKPPMVGRVGAGDSDPIDLRSESTILFVTSPAGYGRFEHLKSKVIDKNKINEAQGLVLAQWHDRMTSSVPIKIFDSAPGSAIEIYNVANPQQP
jgi:hypothetical protein